MTFELTILGSSSAIPTSEKYPTAQVLNALERFFLIDCGEGTQIQLRRQRIGFGKIKHIFISHLHGDHYYGLIGLISTFNLMGLKNNLHIYAPSQLMDVIQPQLAFLKGDMQFEVIFHPLNFKKPDLIFEDKKVEVHSFPVRHSINCCGFLFREKQREANIKKESITKYQIPIEQIKFIKQGADFVTTDGITIPNSELTTAPPPPRSYAYCADTAFHPPIAGVVKDVDLMYHEATFAEDLRDWADKTYHSTAKDAARIAGLANAKKLLIGHFSSRYDNEQVLLNEALSVFTNTEIAIEGRSYKVEQKQRPY
ncbi:MAG TPA: ribonuclease Z [Mariniphaga sp.]|nr:ribonuclease Z [Mariniphaga sp.]